MTTVSEKQATGQSLKCMVCGGVAKKTFPKSFQGVEISYYRCETCDHLTANVFDPDKLYLEDNYFTEVDHGWEARNKRVLKFLKLFSRLPGIKLPLGIKTLDYGCGVGSLVKDLAQLGNDAFGYEPFPNPECQLDNIITESAALAGYSTSFQLVTMIEVLEHLRSPEKQLAEIRELLKKGGYLMISTGIFRNGLHSSDWYYLNPIAGHVSIYSERSIQTLLESNGFSPVFRVNDDIWLFRNADRPNTFEKSYFYFSDLRVQRKYATYAK